MSGENYERMTVAVENLGGIRSEQVAFERGVSVLAGRNATNRTSLLQAIGSGLGGSSGELKSDADEGSVTLAFDGDEYTRTLERDEGTVGVGGEPYTEDSTLVDQYATLLADNPARRAVERGDSDALREVIMAPVDTDEIRETIREKKRAVESLREELEAAKRKQERVPTLERDLRARREELAEVTDDLEAIRETVAEFEADADDAEAAEGVVDELQQVRQEYERTQEQRETQQRALESLREERAEIESALADLPEPDGDRDGLEEDLERLQRRERELMNTINNLLSIVEFNEQLAEEGDVPDDGDSVTDRLNPETDTVECWTCGTSVQRQQIDEQLESLRGVVSEKRRERNSVQSDIDELRGELDRLREAADRRESLQTQLSEIDGEIQQRESRLESLSSTVEDQRERIETLEAEAAESDDLRDSDLLERYQRLSELEYERGQLAEQVESLESELAAVREEASQVEALESRLADRKAELSSARTRIEELERSAVETFNEHMATMLDLLGYDNVERVWIERKVGGEGTGESSFDLHVVRATESDVVYEDTIAHLSESERTVIGFVVALAGYLVHDVHESVPVMVLDSLEAIDAERIAALVEYFGELVPFLVVALLPEDAAALPEHYDRIPMGKAAA